MQVSFSLLYSSQAGAHYMGYCPRVTTRDSVSLIGGIFYIPTSSFRRLASHRTSFPENLEKAYINRFTTEMDP